MRQKQLSERIDFSRETWNPKQSPKFPYIPIGDIDLKTSEVQSISEISLSNVPSRAKMVVRENDIIISKTRPSRGALCLIDKRWDGFIALTGFAVVRPIKAEINRKYLFHALRFDSTLKQFEQRCPWGN